jgi:hypothetical protein
MNLKALQRITMSAQQPAPADLINLEEYRAKKRVIRVLEERAREQNVDLGCVSTGEMLLDFERSLRAFVAASAKVTKVEVVTQSLDVLRDSSLGQGLN